MPIYEMTSDRLREIGKTSFTKAGIRERVDLQRLLRNQIEVIAPDTLIISEEFDKWGGTSHRRIDLLAIDKNANLVVIELKRTDDGGFMELQALRYAAMVSTMTFDKAVEFYAEHLRYINDGEKDARQGILDFLDWEDPDEEHFAADVRIVLVSAGFLPEVTTTVLWLNDYGLDIQCVQLTPYQDGERILIDVLQVLPLREATDYQIKVGVKNRQKRLARTLAKDLTKYDVTINGTSGQRLAKRNAIFFVIKNLCDAGVKPEKISKLVHWRTKSLFFVLDGHLSAEDFVVKATKQHKAGGKRFEQRRWFCSEGELICCDNQTYALSNQWGHRWGEAMNLLVENFPDAKLSYLASNLE